MIEISMIVFLEILKPLELYMGIEKYLYTPCACEIHIERVGEIGNTLVENRICSIELG